MPRGREDGYAQPVGRVIFVSAGPGAADLITVRGARALATADIVLADALADPALQELAPKAHWSFVGKRGFEHSAKQAEINAQLVQAAQTHAVVVRLKGGDASVFGRLEEELQALAEAGIASEVIPGVTAASAAAALTQRPLTRRGRGRNVSLTTAMTADGELRAALSADTEVFYMAGRQLASLGPKLIAAGWAPDAPALVVSRAGWDDALSSQHPLCKLADAAPVHGGRPAVLIVGTGALPASNKIDVSPETLTPQSRS